MRFLIFIIVCCVLIGGCGRKEEAAAEAPASSPADMSYKHSQFMAYEHRIELDVDEGKVVSVHKVAESFCIKDAANECEILESSLDSGAYGSSARLKVRAKPAGIQTLMDNVSTGANVTHQSITGEDLAEPIADTSKQLEMLKAYRSKLEMIGKKPAIDIDALIKVNKELVEAQSQIEDLAGKHAHLMKRVNTEILTIFISSPLEKGFFRPIFEAIKGFKTNFSTAISSVIIAFAFILPWIIVISLLWWGVKKIRPYFKKKITQ